MIFRRRRSRLGIGISSDAVRAIVLEDGRMTSFTEHSVDDESDLRAALRAVIDDASRSRTLRGPVTIAVGPAFAQLRHLHGLPSVRDARTLSAIVQQSAGRYFRQNGIPLVTTPVTQRTNDGAWVGAIEAPVLDAIADVFRDQRMSSLAVVPTAAVLGHVAPDGTSTWHDGEVAIELHFTGMQLTECRSVPSRISPTAHGHGARLPAALNTLGADALRFADAYAAARSGGATPLALRPERGTAQPGARRMALGAAACVASIAFALLAPALAAARVEHEAETRLTTLAATALPASRTARALADSARLLSRLVGFQRATASKTLLLAALTCAIEEPTMLLSLRFESAGGMLTALTPSAAALLEMLDSVPELEAPTIVGSVTPESPTPMVGATPGPTPSSERAERSLERVTVRFQWRSDRTPRQPMPRCAE